MQGIINTLYDNVLDAVTPVCHGTPLVTGCGEFDPAGLTMPPLPVSMSKLSMSSDMDTGFLGKEWLAQSKLGWEKTCLPYKNL